MERVLPCIALLKLRSRIHHALEAGKVIAQNIGNLDRVKVNRKSAYELVSEVDIRAEQTIIQILDEAFPTYNIVSEESGSNDRQHELTWITDPKDGTDNF